MINTEKATALLDTHARLLERRRFELHFRGGDPGQVLTALAGYRNADGGFGWALHPDLRDAASQPVAAIHAVEVVQEVAQLRSPMAPELCDWLERTSLADGGLPFTLPGAGGPGSAPLWSRAEPGSSLLMTGSIGAIAHRVAEHDPAIAGHRWLERATAYCMNEIAAIEELPHAITFRFALQFLDSIAATSAAAASQLERLGALIPESGRMAVAGGAEGEEMRPLDFSPEPDRPLRALMPADAIADDLDRLEDEQDEEGGWDVDFAVFSPAAVSEWRGYRSLWALNVLRLNGRLGDDAFAEGQARQS